MAYVTTTGGGGIEQSLAVISLHATGGRFDDRLWRCYTQQRWREVQVALKETKARLAPLLEEKDADTVPTVLLGDFNAPMDRRDVVLSMAMYMTELVGQTTVLAKVTPAFVTWLTDQVTVHNRCVETTNDRSQSVLVWDLQSFVEDPRVRDMLVTPPSDLDAWATFRRTVLDHQREQISTSASASGYTADCRLPFKPRKVLFSDALRIATKQFLHSREYYQHLAAANRIDKGFAHSVVKPTGGRAAKQFPEEYIFEVGDAIRHLVVDGGARLSPAEFLAQMRSYKDGTKTAIAMTDNPATQTGEDVFVTVTMVKQKRLVRNWEDLEAFVQYMRGVHDRIITNTDYTPLYTPASTQHKGTAVCRGPGNPWWPKRNGRGGSKFSGSCVDWAYGNRAFCDRFNVENVSIVNLEAHVEGELSPLTDHNCVQVSLRIKTNHENTEQTEHTSRL